MKAITLSREIEGQSALIPYDRIITDDKGCWIWTGAKQDDYGIIYIRGKREFVHRAMYQLFVGPVNNNRELDHLCRNHSCCNPYHLEPITSRENSLRGNHPLFIAHRKNQCLKGHDLTNLENVRFRKDGRRRCLICDRQTLKNWRKTRKEGGTSKL